MSSIGVTHPRAKSKGTRKGAYQHTPTFSQKDSGAYFTSTSVSRTLVKWAVTSPADLMLDPSCGDGQFLACHQNSVGVEQNPITAARARERTNNRNVIVSDFFAWAQPGQPTFDCVAGNPPFIRYQSFAGQVRKRALESCLAVGVNFSGLTSSWAPFLVVASSMLKPSGRLAFVVPAEIGHAPYASPLLKYLTDNFSVVHIIAIRDKIFPDLSEDCWLLFASGYGSNTSRIRFTAVETFEQSEDPPEQYQSISVAELEGVWNYRLRPFILGPTILETYQAIARDPRARRLRDVAKVGIGYVTGDNSFFHLKPSDASRLGIPAEVLLPTIRKGGQLPNGSVSPEDVNRWVDSDDEILLLRIPKESSLPDTVKDYLASPAGQAAKLSFKCQNRSPWYSVPDVRIPDYFLSYMSGVSATLSKNLARCSATNSVHCVEMIDSSFDLQSAWESLFTELSCEIEGHPLGGGMLKLEPREAGSILLASGALRELPDNGLLREALTTMRSWRHYANKA